MFARAAGSSDKTKFASVRNDESRSYGENTMIFENLYIKHVCWTPVGATQNASDTVLLIIRVEGEQKRFTSYVIIIHVSAARH